MTHPKNPVKIATIGLFVLATLYPVGLALLAINLKAPEWHYNDCEHKASANKSAPPRSSDTVDMNSFRYRLLLK
jgi:hypothetical protein